jgi:uncharacterized protein (DUF697 family)
MSDTRKMAPAATTTSKAPRRRRLYAAEASDPAPIAEPPAPAAAAPEATALAAPPATVPRRNGTRSPLLRDLRSRQTIRDHALLAAGAMVIPVPLVDMAAEAAIQVRMVKRLAEIHGVDFAEERAKTLVAAAIGGFSAGWAAGTLLRYASFASYFTNFWPSAALSSAITYGIGHLFAQHFSKGGHLDDLPPEVAAETLRAKARSLREHFRSKTAAQESI